MAQIYSRLAMSGQCQFSRAPTSSSPHHHHHHLPPLRFSHNHSPVSGRPAIQPKHPSHCSWRADINKPQRHQRHMQLSRQEWRSCYQDSMASSCPITAIQDSAWQLSSRVQCHAQELVSALGYACWVKEMGRVRASDAPEALFPHNQRSGHWDVG